MQPLIAQLDGNVFGMQQLQALLGLDRVAGPAWSRRQKLLQEGVAEPGFVQALLRGIAGLLSEPVRWERVFQPLSSEL